MVKVKYLRMDFYEIAAYLEKLFFGIRVTKLYLWNVGNTAGQRGMYSFFEKLNIFFQKHGSEPIFF